MVRIACVHTGAGAGIFGLMEKELKKHIQVPMVIRHITDPELISRISAHETVRPEDVAELIRMYSGCVDTGSDIIINMCSSVGDVADVAKPLLKLAGIDIVRIDHRMCQEAVMRHEKIAVVATLSSTLNPSIRLVERCAEEQGKKVHIIPVLVEGAFGLGAEQLAEKIKDLTEPYLSDLDAIVLAQNSMSESAYFLQKYIDKEIFSSPMYAAIEVAELIQKKEA